MKNLRTFESYTVEKIPDDNPIKPYGVPYSLLNLNVDNKVTYKGAPYKVKSVDQYLLILTSLENGKEIKSNQAMFNKYGFIGK
jgi:hypothetical protein